MNDVRSLHIPVIETERTILRAHRLDDFDAYTAMWANTIVTRFIGGRPQTREEAWHRFLRQAGVWSVFGFGFWAIEEKATGSFIGEAGFHDLKRDIVPSIEGVPEAGWGLVPSVHGLGLATEAVSGALAWGDRNLGAERTVCIIDQKNTGSINVAKKCGYVETARTTYHDGEAIIFERR